MALQVKPPLTMPAYVRAPAQVPFPLFTKHITTDVTGKAAEDAPSTQNPAIHAGNLDALRFFTLAWLIPGHCGYFELFSNSDTVIHTLSVK